MAIRTHVYWLSTKAQQKFDKAKEKVDRKLKNSFKCRSFLLLHGFSPEGLSNALNLQQPFDAVRSTLTMGAANLLPGSIETVQHYAARYRGLRAMTATYGGSTVPSRSAVFYLGSGLRGSTILHEALHSYTGLGDADLAARLGVRVSSNNTQPISDILKKNDCT